MASRIVDRDLGWSKVMGALGDLKDRNVRVGFMGGEEHKGGADMATIAAVQEEGLEDKGIPARPVIRPVADAQGPSIADRGARWIAAHVDQSNAIDIGLGRVGLDAQSQIKAAYVHAFEHVEPLKQATIDARKRRSVGSDHPLVDTGQLVGSVQFEVM